MYSFAVQSRYTMLNPHAGKRNFVALCDIGKLFGLVELFLAVRQEIMTYSVFADS